MIHLWSYRIPLPGAQKVSWDFLKCVTCPSKTTCTMSIACGNPVPFNGENFLKSLFFEGSDDLPLVSVIHPATMAIMICSIMADPQVGVVGKIDLFYAQLKEYQCSSVGQIFQHYGV